MQTMHMNTNMNMNNLNNMFAVCISWLRFVVWLHLPAQRCFLPLQRTIHLKCRTRPHGMKHHGPWSNLFFMFVSFQFKCINCHSWVKQRYKKKSTHLQLFDSGLETSMQSAVTLQTGPQTRLLHGGLQLDFADALCESHDDLILCWRRFGNKAKVHQNTKSHAISPGISSWSLSYVIHAGVATCQRSLCIRNVPCSPCSSAPTLAITGTLHFLIQEAGSFPLAQRVTTDLGHVSTVSTGGNGFSAHLEMFPTCCQFPPTHPYTLDLVQHHVANANEAGHSLSLLAHVFSPEDTLASRYETLENWDRGQRYQDKASLGSKETGQKTQREKNLFNISC